MFIGDSDSSKEASVEPRTQTPTGNALNVQIGPGDPIGNMPVIIDFGHHQIHEGESHSAEDMQVALAASTVKYGLTVPADVYPHMIVGADAYNGSVLVQVYEGSTFTGGTVVPSFNRNRNSSIVPGVTIKTGVASTTGTLIHSFYVGAGSRSANSDRAGNERPLKANTLYRIDLIGQTVGTSAIAAFDWYEDLGV